MNGIDDRSTGSDTPARPLPMPFAARPATTAGGTNAAPNDETFLDVKAEAAMAAIVRRENVEAAPSSAAAVPGAASTRCLLSSRLATMMGSQNSSAFAAMFFSSA